MYLINENDDCPTLEELEVILEELVAEGKAIKVWDKKRGEFLYQAVGNWMNE